MAAHNQRPPACGCCFIVPPSLLKSIALGQHKLTAHDPQMFQDSLAETQRLRTVRASNPLPAAPAPGTGGAVTGSIQQRVFDCQHKTSLPGKAIADPNNAGPAIKTIYQTTSKVAEFYRTVLGRNSIDDHGANLVSSINYSQNYQNAIWNNQQMIYGNGDQKIFTDFWRSPDVIAHELTHGVTQHESALPYEGEAGALNESLSDCFGAAFSQWSTKAPASGSNGWLLGTGIIGPASKAKGVVCLRDMISPAATHCMHPQPESYADLDPLAEAHVNSGVPNKAFALFARAVGGNSYDLPIKVWYTACTGGRLSSDADFSDFAKLTIQAAEQLGSGQKANLASAVRDAWAAVKVDPTST